MDHPTFAEPSVYCGTCGSMCSIMNTRVSAKGNKTFRCLKCCTRVTQLFRQHGCWPTPEFKQLSVPDQKKFFQDIATVTSAAELRTKTEEYFEKFNTSQDFYEESGQFNPLSVWDRMGFSTEDIVAKSVEADKAIHPVLGPVYRVKLLTKGSKGSMGWTRKSAVDATTKRRKTSGSLGSGASATAVAAAAAAKDTSVEESDAGSDSSSSSSSSSSGGKTTEKNAKKAKKDKNTKKGEEGKERE